MLPAPALPAWCRIGDAGAARATSGAMHAQMLEQTLPGYLLLNTEPWADAVLPAALSTLAASGVVAITPYASEQMRRVARVMLPAGTFAETSGTYVSLEGRWQTHAGAARRSVRRGPGGRFCACSAIELELPQFEYQTSEQVRDELGARFKRGGRSGRPAAAAASSARRTGARMRGRAGARSADVSDRCRSCGARSPCSARATGARRCSAMGAGQ